MRIVIFAVFLVISGTAFVRGAEKLSSIAPSQLPNTNRQMNTAGFWISRHPAPDDVIMDAGQIQAFNGRIQNELKLTKDIFSATQTFQTESLMTVFNKLLKDFEQKGYYTADGQRESSAFLDKVRDNMNLSDVVLGIVPSYALVVHYTDVRFFPTAEGLYESSGDVDFDQVQNSSLDVGTAVAIVHQSKDKQWYYVLSSLADGWVPAKDVAVGEVKAIQDFAQAKNFVIVTRSKADIYLDESKTSYHDYARMGARLPLMGFAGNRAKVLVPVFDKDSKLEIIAGYMNRTEVRKGYLPFTARSIYTQAFAMLNEPYGWGGMYGEQDCSAFLDEVFATVGIILPRDSKDQALVGAGLAQFDEKAMPAQKLEAFKQITGANAILHLKGHVLLYLGVFEDRPYAIHAVWAYRESKGEQDMPRVMNRVVVSDLSLGEGSQKGSLLKRLAKIIEIK